MAMVRSLLAAALLAIGGTAAQADQLMRFDIGTEIASVAVPDEFVQLHTQPGLAEMIVAGEKFESWTRIFTIASFPKIDSATRVRRDSEANFFKTCKQKNAVLTVDDPAGVENGFPVVTWVQACDLTRSGPSAGKPETNVVKLVQGKGATLYIMLGFRTLPSASDIEAAKATLAKSTLFPR